MSITGKLKTPYQIATLNLEDIVTGRLKWIMCQSTSTFQLYIQLGNSEYDPGKVEICLINPKLMQIRMWHLIFSGKNCCSVEDFRLNRATAHRCEAPCR
jgi:hypothetical protein